MIIWDALKKELRECVPGPMSFVQLLNISKIQGVFFTGTEHKSNIKLQATNEIIIFYSKLFQHLHSQSAKKSCLN